METRSNGQCWWVATIAATSITLLWATVSLAQRGGGRSHGDSAAYSGGGGGSSDKPAVPDPYGGQLYCPVTGTKLGLTQPPVAVQTAIGEEKPSFWGKLVGKTGTRGAVIYVCCSECVEKVRRNPQAYLDEIVADKGCFSFSYGKAPAKRPPRGSIDAETLPTPGASGKTP